MELLDQSSAIFPLKRMKNHRRLGRHFSPIGYEIIPSYKGVPTIIEVRIKKEPMMCNLRSSRENEVRGVARGSIITSIIAIRRSGILIQSHTETYAATR
jgi:hypothetical protein